MVQIWKSLSKGMQLLIIAILLVGGLYGVYTFDLIPGLKSEKSKEVAQFKGDNKAVYANEQDETAMLPVPNADDAELTELQVPEVRMENWVWFGTAPYFTANGGLNTTKGSLMEKNGVKLKIITQNSVDVMKADQLAFIKAYAGGDKNPTVGVPFVTLMGDGAGPYISAMNKNIAKIGDEFKLKIVNVVAFSDGEDCVFGPSEWKSNPSSLKGSVISAVIGDGDWCLGVRFAADNKDENGNPLKVNPDPDTYDPNAVNFVNATDNDFLKAAEDVIGGKVVELRVKDENGKITGKTVTKVIQGAATWFPGDRNLANKTDLVKVISTTEYNNQMANVLVGPDKWMKDNTKAVVGIITASLSAANQIKKYEKWFQYACTLAPQVFCSNPADCEENAEAWMKFAVPGGSTMKNTAGQVVGIGGTRMASLADVKKYFGLRGGNNYYKSIYEYFRTVVNDLNPGDAKGQYGGVIPYDEAVDLSYLQKVNLNTDDAGLVTAIDYSKNKGNVFASKDWQIQFATGSTTITNDDQLNAIFDALNNAESAKVKIIGYTDNVGNDESNLDLSKRRAQAVKQWLIKKSNGNFPSTRFVTDGMGKENPIGDNTTTAGKAKNRRVEIQLSN